MGMLRQVALRFGIDPEKFIRVAQCESGLRPRAQSPRGTFRGLFQQHYRYWPARARRAGLAGASVFDAQANAVVSAWMIRESGWGAWPHCGD